MANRAVSKFLSFSNFLNFGFFRLEFKVNFSEMRYSAARRRIWRRPSGFGGKKKAKSMKNAKMTENRQKNKNYGTEFDSK